MMTPMRWLLLDYWIDRHGEFAGGFTYGVILIVPLSILALILDKLR